ncbi:FliM/FliN family flagellar motor switch protein [Bartonella sp. DGB2]|uniref:FliM/FliN family flagellar motor switch protein n=1 Tax=Bartonella sp. DGB2 TaxID=3388426 RepID=UPI00398FF252
MTEHSPSIGNQAASDKKRSQLAQYILRAAGLSSDDLIAFRHVFSEATTQLCARLIPYTSQRFFAEIASLTTLKADHAPSQIPQDTLIMHFSAHRWGGDVFMLLNDALISLVVDAFFGADQSNVSNRGGRPFSVSEIEIANTFAQLFAQSLDGVFGDGDNTLLLYQKTLANSPPQKELPFGQTALFSCTIHLKTEENISPSVPVNQLTLLMPRTCHHPIQEVVAKALHAPSVASDPLWAKRLRQEVRRTNIKVEAVITQSNLPLSALSKLYKGQVLPLPPNAIQNIKLQSGQQALYKGSLGKIGSHFSVKISNQINEEEEALNELAHY